MITVSPEKDREIVKKLFLDNGLQFNEFSSCVIARFGEEVLGFCLYELDSKTITVHKVSPNDDIMLADGILRSALHVAAERSIMDARYSNLADEELFLKLQFVKDKEAKTLDIDKLFGGCGCGGAK